MQRGVLGWILEQKKDISVNTGEFQIKVYSVANNIVPMLLS